MTADISLSRAWLANLPPFANSSPGEQDDILHLASVLSLRSGATVFEQGAPADADRRRRATSHRRRHLTAIKELRTSRSLD
ncbi:hypothetical protein ACNFBT_08375 [Pseudomonas sp. NY15181]|uniref:hypothetical protein n=1 Tax=Pseudomonas sp. NY15181 TaxID=3400349 RepID=UPI003A857301